MHQTCNATRLTHLAPFTHTHAHTRSLAETAIQYLETTAHARLPGGHLGADLESHARIRKPLRVSVQTEGQELVKRELRRLSRSVYHLPQLHASMLKGTLKENIKFSQIDLLPL